MNSQFKMEVLKIVSHPFSGLTKIFSSLVIWNSYKNWFAFFDLINLLSNVSLIWLLIFSDLSWTDQCKGGLCVGCKIKRNVRCLLRWQKHTRIDGPLHRWEMSRMFDSEKCCKDVSYNDNDNNHTRIDRPMHRWENSRMLD